jgi:hypothetical protein
VGGVPSPRENIDLAKSAASLREVHPSQPTTKSFYRVSDITKVRQPMKFPLFLATNYDGFAEYLFIGCSSYLVTPLLCVVAVILSVRKKKRVARKYMNASLVILVFQLIAYASFLRAFNQNLKMNPDYFINSEVPNDIRKALIDETISMGILYSPVLIAVAFMVSREKKSPETGRT